MAMDTCSIRRCRWPLFAFINTQVCFKKWEVWVSSVYLSSGCCNFQSLKACQANMLVKINTQHWATTRDFRAHLNTSHQCLHGLTSSQGYTWGLVWSDDQIQHHAGSIIDTTLGRPNLIYDGLEKYRTNIVHRIFLPGLNTPTRWFNKPCISQILLKPPFMVDVNCPQTLPVQEPEPQDI